MEDLNISTEEFCKKYVKDEKGWYYFWKAFFTPVALLIFRPKIYGKENIPEEGGVILACNHIHMADPAYLVLSTKRVVRFLAKRELLDSILGSIYKGLCAIPVDRKNGAHNSLVAAEYALNKGEVIGIYPEGTRNRNNPLNLLPFKYGTVKLASETHAPVVPVGFVSKGRPFIDDYKVYIGKPYYIEKDADLDKENEILREKILELITKKEKV